MPIPLPKPRHTVEKLNNLVRVTLPSRKSIFGILFICVWFLMWGYLISACIYVFVTFNKIVELEKHSNSTFEYGAGFMVFNLFFLLFILIALGFGLFAVYRFLWVIAGKEVMEADSKLLRVSRQIFSWKRDKEYLADEVKDLRVTSIQYGLMPFRVIRKLFASNQMIAFDYGSKTFRFGSEIEEAEAKQIILALKDGLSQ